MSSCIQNRPGSVATFVVHVMIHAKGAFGTNLSLVNIAKEQLIMQILRSNNS